MKSCLFVALLVLQLWLSEPAVCLSAQPFSPLRLNSLLLKPNKAFTFKIQLHAAPTVLHRTANGTFFQGSFSTLQIAGDNRTYNYTAVGFSFKYPPQHIVAELTQDMIQMQILYQLNINNTYPWKHKRLALSVTFVVTEYAPEEGFSLGRQINQELNNGSIIEFNRLIPLVPGLNMILYKGTHSQFPEDQSFLWLVRRELLLMSEKELKIVKDYIFEHMKQDQIGYHGLVKKLSDLNEISQVSSLTNNKEADIKEGGEM